MLLRLSCSQKEDPPLPTDREDRQAQFYENYRKLAGDYDKEFLKKHEDDLKTTLIFVSRAHMVRLRSRAHQRNRLVCFLPLQPHSS